MLWLSLGVLFLSSAAIAYQDFKTRLISLWLIICFGCSNITYFLLTHSLDDLFINTLFCLCYFSFSYFILQLYFFFKTKKIQKVFDIKIGWGDVWMLFLLGSSMSPVNLVTFFTIVFSAGLLLHLLFSRSNQASIALAGILVIFYFANIVFDILRISGRI